MGYGAGRIYRPKIRGRETTVWWIDYWVHGKRFRQSTHSASKTEAQRQLREAMADREAGRVVGRPEHVTLRDVRAALEGHYARHGNRSWRRAAQALDRLEAYLGPASRVAEITRAVVNDYVDHRIAAGAARATAVYEVRVFGAALSAAVDDGLLAVRPTFKLPRVENARAGFFEDGEFAALVLELPVDVRPVVEFLRMTGWRVGEVLRLTWDQVDWEGACVRIGAAQTKGGDARVFPFGGAPALKALLDARWRVRDGLFVFHRDGKPIKSFRRAWARACRKAGIPGRLVHDLRRTAAREFRRQGVSEGEIMRLCGWRTRAMFDRYNIIDEADLARAVAQRFGETRKQPTNSHSTPPGMVSQVVL